MTCEELKELHGPNSKQYKDCIAENPPDETEALVEETIIEETDVEKPKEKTLRLQLKFLLELVKLLVKT